MNRFIILTSLVAFFAVGAGAQSSKKLSTSKPDTLVATTVIQVPTIVCNSCVATITKAVKKVGGVKTANVDLQKKTATITYASARVTVSKLEQAIANAGYDANNTKRNQAAYEKLDECCKIDNKTK